LVGCDIFGKILIDLKNYSLVDINTGFGMYTLRDPKIVEEELL
jgi:hypothetical protein